MAVTIFPNDRDDARRVAGRLLAAAGAGRHDEVRTSSEGALGLAFVVPDDLAEQVFGVSPKGAGDGVVGAARDADTEVADPAGGAEPEPEEGSARDADTGPAGPVGGAESEPDAGSAGRQTRAPHAGRPAARRPRGR